LDRAPERDRPQPVEAVMAGQRAGEPDVLELLDRAGREAVAAGLLPRVALLLDEEHVVAGLGQPVGAGRPGRPTPDDEDVVPMAHHPMCPVTRRARRSQLLAL